MATEIQVSEAPARLGLDERWTVTAAIGLIAVIGIEPDALWWTWGSVQIRSGQALAIVVVVIALVDVRVRRGDARSSRPRTLPLLLLLYVATVVVSWQMAEVFRRNASATTFRLALVGLLGIAVWTLIRSCRDRAALAVALVSVGVVSAVIGMAAMAAGGEWWFTASLRGAPTELGPHLRLTRPFNHANVAAMVFGPLTVIAAALAARRRPWWIAVVALAVATTLTYSRIVPVAVVIGLAVAMWAGLDRRAAIGAAAVVGVVMLSAAVLSPAWSSRLSSPGNDAWYGIEVQVTDFDATTGAVLVRVENMSDVTWRAGGSDRVELSLRWRSTDDRIQYLDERFALPADLAPGSTLETTLTSRAVEDLAGASVVVIADVVRDREAFFGETTGGAAVETLVLPGEPQALSGSSVVRPVPEMARSDLWRAAVRLTADNPLFGVGTGNYRLLYGDELGLERFPTGSHAHSLYLESAASSGLTAALALIAVLGVVLTPALAQRGSLDDVGAGLVGGVATMATHGLVDWPLVFTASGALFFVLVAAAAPRGTT